MTPIQRKILSALKRKGPLSLMALRKAVPRTQWRTVVNLIDAGEVEGDHRELRVREK
jgi:hypothetical protein